MNINQNIENLKQKGFVTFKTSVFVRAEIDELSDLSKQAYNKSSVNHKNRIKMEEGGEGLRRLPEHNPRISELLNIFFSNENVKTVLTSVMGPDYKIWGIHFRRSIKNDSGLYLHQDAVGQVSVAISLDDNPKGIGATIFVPSSHLIPLNLKSMKLELSHKLLTMFSFLFTPLSSNKGDISIFLNRTWHGRFPNRSIKEHDVILIGMFPSLCKYGYENWSEEYIDSISGSELGKLIDYPSESFISVDREELDIENTDENIYSLSLEVPSVSTTFKLPVQLLYTRLILNILKLVKKMVSPFIKLVKSYKD